ncbi:GtrA family protein [Dactylosporangium sp. NPDC000555]|uniref:GtrA family protein n=1 Tax=Dactylosporangium sp. NPDC000555 TaxID=3154260 RepID=UPI00332E1B7D
MKPQAGPAAATTAGLTSTWRASVGAAMRHSAVRYVITGVVSAAADFGLLYLLHEWLGLPVSVAAFIAVSTAFFLNFALNRVWSFRSTAPVAGQISRYFLLACVNWVLTTIMVGLFTWAGFYYLIAKAIALVVTTASNYLLYRLWVFADRRRHPLETTRS